MFNVQTNQEEPIPQGAEETEDIQEGGEKEKGQQETVNEEAENKNSEDFGAGQEQNKSSARFSSLENSK